MNAFHSFWSKPNSERNQGTVCLPDFELLTAILSALQWRKHNGPIKMITDTEGAAYFKGLGLDVIWDEMDTALDAMNQGTDPIIFWAAGKLYALKQMSLPCVMLDTDLIVWKNMDWVKQFDIVTAHPEPLNPYVYPDPSGFIFNDAYQYPEEWDFTLDAANTAFLYMKDPEFRDYYTDQAIAFFNHVEPEGLDTVSAMCFAEQRVLPMCAAVKHQSMGYLLDLENPVQQDVVTHTWGYKDLLRNSALENQKFCEQCMRRILKEFPEYLEVLDHAGLLKKYFVLDTLEN